ncbi:hypothetical protein N7488_008849 [Penicillium malachiteum]|nr:hypothetical protein N7488_008849 [Penicillium malachiteum]
MSSNSDRARRLAVPPGEHPAHAEAWRNGCHDCGKEGHRAFSAECGLEILRREPIQQTIQLEQMEREGMADALAERQPSELIMQLDERIIELKSEVENAKKKRDALEQQLERAKEGQE